MVETQPGPMVRESTMHRPEDFERAYGDRDWVFYKKLLAGCIQYGEPGQILDLGAGLGLFVECCRQYGIDCIGIEGSEWACRAAFERCGIQMICSNLSEDFPFPSETFSVVMCNQVIEHVDGATATKMLRESCRVLRPNGIMFINSPCHFNKKERVEATHINLYTPTRLREEVRNAGLESIAEPNQFRRVLGRNRLSVRITRMLWKTTKADVLSDTANCIAKKKPLPL